MLTLDLGFAIFHVFQSRCNKFGKELGKKGYKVQCASQCQKWYHEACVKIEGIKLEQIKQGKKRFVCKGCESEVNLGSSDDEDSEASSEEEPVEAKYTLEDVMAKLIKMQKQYEKLFKKFEERTVEVFDQITKFEALHEDIDNIKELLQMDSNKRPSYADATKTIREEVLIIETKIENGDTKKIKEIVTNTVQPEKLKIGIKKVQKVDKGKVAITCENRIDIDKLKMEIDNKLGDQVSTSVKTKKMPKLRIVGIDYSNDTEKRECKWNKSGLKECIIEQNELEGSEFEVVAIVQRNKSFSAIIETSNLIHSRLLSMSRLKIGWGLCRVYDHIDLTRCFKCNGFNHKAKNCKNNASCGFCAGGGHISNNCEVDDKNIACVNCLNANEKWNMNLETNHSAFDPICKVYQRKADVARKQFDYGDSTVYARQVESRKWNKNKNDSVEGPK